MDSPARILVIEDEEPIRRGLCDVLVLHGHDPTGSATGDDGLARGLEEDWDLLLVDVMLPGVDGFTICRRVRQRHPSRGILMLTARGSEDDILEGFSAGADDYVTKPFSVAQLLARVQALLRRTGPKNVPVRFELGPAVIDADALQLEIDGECLALTRRDVKLLGYLTERPGRVVSREELLLDVWGYQCVDRVETRCVDMHISKFRRRLAEISDVELIETVRGAGYKARL
ncbi:MAG: response regulator transcription factor [Myxococcales bacterium]|nr:response regulator transcription factor [Myxococcales bacterium]